MMTNSKWLMPLKQVTDAAFRVVCFPHAGGGALAFSRLAKLMPDWIEVLAMVAPGREMRIREPFASGVAEIACATANRLKELPELPQAFFGHSMGAILAFECAQLLRDDRTRAARHLFLSGRRAYGPIPVESMIAHLPAREFVREISIRYGGIPRQVLEDQSLLDVFLPVIQADMMALERHPFTPQPPLELSITLFGGSDDPQCTDEAWAGWGRCATGKVKHIRFPGDHFYLHAQAQGLSEALVNDILPFVTGEGVSVERFSTL
jgi:medium-chain acyl-[acyl-carrier-protein] hydrolase